MYDSIELGKPKWGGEEFQSIPDMHEDKLDEMIRLYREELLSFEEIGNKLNIDWWTIKTLFKKHNIPRYTLKERAKLKRKMVYPLIYKLHYEDKKTLNEIYKNYGFSPPYCRQVLREGLSESFKET